MRSHYRLFALSPDNDLMLRKLTHLFWASYGRSYPIPGVYDLQFWKSHIGTRFVSIVVEHEGEMLCHIAYSEEVGAPGSVHLEHLVCHPEHFSVLPEIAHALSDYLLSVAERKQWHTLLATVMSGLPGTSLFLRDSLQCEELGILPGYYPNHQIRHRPLSHSVKNGHTSSKRHAAQVFVRLFREPSVHPRTIFVPEKHASVVNTLRERLHLSRTLQHGYIAKEPLAYSLPADTPAVRTCHYYQTGVSHSFLQPSLLPHTDDYLDEIVNCSNTIAPFLFINCEDPQAPHAIEEIEKNGFCFGGYLPRFFGYDQLIYFKRTSLQDSLIKEMYRTPEDSLSVLAEHIGAFAEEATSLEN